MRWAPLFLSLLMTPVLAEPVRTELKLIRLSRFHLGCLKDRKSALRGQDLQRTVDLNVLCAQPVAAPTPAQ